MVQGMRLPTGWSSAFWISTADHEADAEQDPTLPISSGSPMRSMGVRLRIRSREASLVAASARGPDAVLHQDRCKCSVNP